MIIDWKDGSDPEVFPFDNGPVPQYTHNYTENGIYDPEAMIFNAVSSTNVSCTVKIVEEILDLEITNWYFMTEAELNPRPGFGRLKNQYPMDKNLTFFPYASRGTITFFEVRHTVNNSLIFTFNTADEFDPLVDHFKYHFDFEVFLNITVLAINEFETKSVDLFLEIVGQVRVLKINDYAIVSKPGEDKFFEITFESIGGGTCLILSWGEGTPLQAFGEELTCRTNFSHAVYNPEPQLDISMNFTQLYP